MQIKGASLSIQRTPHWVDLSPRGAALSKVCAAKSSHEQPVLALHPGGISSVNREQYYTFVLDTKNHQFMPGFRENCDPSNPATPHVRRGSSHPPHTTNCPRKRIIEARRKPEPIVLRAISSNGDDMLPVRSFLLLLFLCVYLFQGGLCL